MKQFHVIKIAHNTVTTQILCILQVSEDLNMFLLYNTWKTGLSLSEVVFDYSHSPVNEAPKWRMASKTLNTRDVDIINWEKYVNTSYPM